MRVFLHHAAKMDKALNLVFNEERDACVVQKLIRSATDQLLQHD